MLSLWRWGATLDLVRTTVYSEQSIVTAMQLGLHEMDKYSRSATGRAVESQDWHKDMSRRTWWTIYAHQLQSAQASGSKSVMSHDDPRIQVDFPACSIDDKSWSTYIDTIRECSRVLDLVISVYYAGDASKLEGNYASIESRRQMFSVDADILDLLEKAEENSVIDFVTGGEEEVVRNQQLSSRLGLAVLHIHVHRHQAFPEVSLFSKMMCGLPEMPPLSTEPIINAPDDTMPPSLPADANSTLPGMPSTHPVSTQATMDISSLNLMSVSHTKPFPVTLPYPDPVYAPFPTDGQDQFAFINDMWEPETYPETLPEPWFVHSGGAGALFAPIETVNTFQAPLTATLGEIESQSRSSFSSSMPSSLSPPPSCSSFGISGRGDRRADSKENSPRPSIASSTAPASASNSASKNPQDLHKKTQGMGSGCKR